MQTKVKHRSAGALNSYKAMETLDCETHSRGTTGWSNAYRQVKREPFAGHIQVAEFGSLQIVREQVRNPVEYHGAPVDGTIGFVVRLPSAGEAYCHGRPLGANTILKFPNNYSHRAFCTGAMDTLVVTLDLDSFANYVDRMTQGEIDRNRLEGGFRVGDPDIVDHFTKTVLSIIERASEAPALYEDVKWRDHNIETVHGLLLQALKAGASTPSNLPAPSTRAYVVDKAVRFMETHIAEKLPMSRICDAVRICPRTLRYSFEQIVGVSPMQYMFSLRLHAARRVLLNGDADKPIHRVAEQFGFEHLSRFAQYYREAFGELPSETTASCARSVN